MPEIMQAEIDKIKVLQDKIQYEAYLLSQLQKELCVVGGCRCNFRVKGATVCVTRRCDVCNEYPTTMKDGQRGFLKYHDNFAGPTWHKKTFDPVGGHAWVQRNRAARTKKSCLESGRAFLRKRKVERELEQAVKHVK